MCVFGGLVWRVVRASGGRLAGRMFCVRYGRGWGQFFGLFCGVCGMLCYWYLDMSFHV